MYWLQNSYNITKIMFSYFDQIALKFHYKYSRCGHVVLKYNAWNEQPKIMHENKGQVDRVVNLIIN